MSDAQTYPRGEANVYAVLMPPDSLSDWQALLSMQASAAATLTGLVFVAVSINLTRIVATSLLTVRVVESLVQFLQVFFVCSVMIIPHQSSFALAIEVLSVSFISWAMQILGFVRYYRARLGNPHWWLGLRLALTHCSAVPFFVVAIDLLLGLHGSLYWSVAGFLFSFVAGLFNTWVLLIEVARRT
jgi:hypothetical protein